MLGIFLVGILRFGLSVSGVTDNVTRYASMTGVILAAIVYFGFKQTGRRQRLAIAYALIAPYMLVEAVGLGFTLMTERATIFHAAPYSLGTSAKVHFWGHIVGGLTWEPLLVFFLISALGYAGRKGSRRTRIE